MEFCGGMSGIDHYDGDPGRIIKIIYLRCVIFLDFSVLLHLLSHKITHTENLAGVSASKISINGKFKHQRAFFNSDSFA